MIWVSVDEYDKYGNFQGVAILDTTAFVPVPEGTFLLSKHITDGLNLTFNIYPRNKSGKIKICTYTPNPLFPIPGPAFAIKIQTHYIDLILPAPAAPNGGLIVGCYPGEVVPITSAPTVSDCNFHCDYMWNAPSGFLLRKASATDAPIQRNATGLVFPSGSISNGSHGQVRVDALYNECGKGEYTSSYATVFYGKPIIVNPQIRHDYPNSQYLSFWNQLEPPLTWTIISANSGASITPHGNTGECTTHNMTWGIVEVSVPNRCGTTAYRFYINISETFSVYPNPAKEEINIEFQDKSLIGSIYDEVFLLDSKGNIVRSYHSKGNSTFQSNSPTNVRFNLRGLSKGTYFIHMKGEKGIEKSQILIE